MNVSTRKAKLNDLTPMLELFVNCVYDVCKKDYEPNQLEAWASAASNSKRWTDKIGNQYFIVAQIKDKIVGFTSLEGNDTVDILYVHKDFQNMGIASLLFNSILDRVKVTGCQTLYAEVSKTALPFFEHKGFEVVTEQMKIVQGVAIVNYQMVKFL